VVVDFLFNGHTGNVKAYYLGQPGGFLQLISVAKLLSKY